MDLKQFYLKQKQAVYVGTKDVYSKIPAPYLGWRPADDMLTLGEIVRHTWMSEEGTRRLALLGDFGYYEKRIPLGLEGILGRVESLEDELVRLAEVHETTMREVEAFPLERFEEERVNESLGMRRKVSVLLFAIIEHHIHHRAQVGMQVRILTGNRASPYAL
jgi:hypothetical protein